jgi:hypothetical protein
MALTGNWLSEVNKRNFPVGKNITGNFLQKSEKMFGPAGNL